MATSSHPYSIKNFSKEYLEEYIRFCCETSAFGLNRKEFVTSFVTKTFKRPQYSPQKDLYLAVCDNQVVGFLDMIPELKIGRMILRAFIHPEHRRLGLATEMFDAAWERAEDLGAKVFHVCLTENQEAGDRLMERWDFVPVRRFFELKKELSDITAIKPPANIELGYFSSGEEALLAEIQNKCFAGSWGFCPNSPKEIAYYLEYTDCRLEDIHAARLEKDRKVVGYCWTHLLEKGNDDQSQTLARIHMFGVDPDYQGQGLGRALLSKGMHVLKEKGTRCVELTVDKYNRLALFLYKSSGFKKISTSTWYEKIL